MYIMRKIISGLLISILISFNSVCFADVNNDVQVNLTQLPLKTKLRKDYSAYKYVIQNNGNQKLNLINAQIVNGVNGSVAYNTVDNDHPIAVTWAICGPVGLITLGIGWAVGIVATPVVWVISSSSKGHARTESNAYSNIVDLGYIDKGASITVNTLVPVGTKPQLKLTFQEENTKDLVLINK